MFNVTEKVTRHRLLRSAAMVALVVPAALLAGCPQPQPVAYQAPPPQPATYQPPPPPPATYQPPPPPPARYGERG
jgi:hypothetical protein